jgi:transcriptional regulator with XRE-family HTH domain
VAKTDLSALGKKIALARKDLGLTQKGLAAEIGVHWITVADWERGKAEPTLENLRAVAERTQRALEWFLEAA